MTSRDTEERERGSALIITMVLIMMVLGLVLVGSQLSMMRSQVAVGETRYMQLEEDAEAGMGIKFELIAASDSDPAVVTAALNQTLPSGNTLAVSVVDLGDDTYEVTSLATNAAGEGVEVVATISAAIHPTFRKALYVGNKDGLPVPVRLGPVNNLTSTASYDESAWRSENYRLDEEDLGIDLNSDADYSDNPRIKWVDDYAGWAAHMQRSGDSYRIDLDKDGTYGTYTKTIVNAPEFASPTGTEAPATDWATNHQGDGDYIDGEIHVNGDAEIRANTLVFDEVSATGTVASTAS